MNGYYQPWISDKEPKTPKGWGLSILLGRASNIFTCAKCTKEIKFSKEYIYTYKVTGTEMRHNTEECASDLRT